MLGIFCGLIPDVLTLWQQVLIGRLGHSLLATLWGGDSVNILGLWNT